MITTVITKNVYKNPDFPQGNAEKIFTKVDNSVILNRSEIGT